MKIISLVAISVTLWVSCSTTTSTENAQPKKSTARLAKPCRWDVKKLKYFIGTPIITIDETDYKSTITAALKAWTDIIGLPIEEVDDIQDAHVALVWNDDPDHKWRLLTYAWGELPGDCSFKEKGLPKPVVFTTKKAYSSTEKYKWSINGAKDAYDLYSVALHEFGHILGLRHCVDRIKRSIDCPDAAVMHKYLRLGQIKDTLTKSDTLRIEALYGSS